MVMLKILQQHYRATGDERVIACLAKYFQYQLQTLPIAPLHDPKNPRSGSWWAAERGGDRAVYGLLTGYPCCTCNYHQGWPKFTQHLWLASADGGLAALTYAPSKMSARVAGGVALSRGSATNVTDAPLKSR